MPRSERAPYPYDCQLGGRGLMLTSGPAGEVAWRERKLKFFPARVSQTDSTYAQFPPEDEAIWAVDDLSAGFGRRTVPVGGSRHYYYGFVDTRIPNQITLAPELSEGPSGGGGTVNDHFELGGVLYVLVGSGVYRSADGSNWTLSKDFGAGAVAKSAAVFKGSAAVPHAFVAVGGSPADGAYWTFDGTSWLAHAGELVDPLAVLKTTDGGATYSDYTAAATDENPATHVAISSLNTVANGDWLLIGNVIPFTSVSIDMDANINTHPATWTAVAGLADGTSSGGASFAQDGAVTFAEPTAWKAASFDGVWAFWLRLSVSAVLDVASDIDEVDVRESRKADRFLVVGDQLLRVSAQGGRPTLAKSNDGGSAATWNVGLSVGDGSHAVTNLLGLGGVPYLTKADSVYAIRSDAGGDSAQQDLWPHPAQSSDPDNGRGACAWRSYLWLPLRQGFYRLAPGELTAYGPELLAENDSPVRGRVTACAGDDYFLYAVVRSETGTSYLLALDHDRAAWHPLADLGARECRHMWVADVPGPNPRLYLGLDASVAWIVLPRGSANPLHDANCRYASSGELHLSRFHGNFVSQAKTYLALAVIGERLSPQSYVDAAYRIVTDAAYTTLGRFAVAEGQRIEFGTPATGTFIDLRFVLGTIDPQTTPVIRAVTLAYAVRTGLKRVFEFFVRVADHLPLRDGGLDRQSARDIKRAVTDAAAADGPTSLVSPDGEVLDVIVRDLEAQAQRNEAGRELTWVMPVTATEYRQSAVSGSQNRLAAYRHEQLAAYTHAQLTSL